MKSKISIELGINLLLGVAVGDALGVPFEFYSRKELTKNPAIDMVGYQTHNQPPGTWSDDFSLTYCLAQTIQDNYSSEKVANNFIKWKNNGFLSANGNVFDIGITTNKSIDRLEQILKDGKPENLKLLKNFSNEQDNGNGSLMRILPLLLEIMGKDILFQFETIWENSALTHGHIRAAMSCMIYLKFAENILWNDKIEAYQLTIKDILNLWNKISFPKEEKKHFNRIIHTDIQSLKRDDIKSGGYVIETLEASIWSFLNSDNFSNAVLMAINLGEDTDTTGAVTGGLAGIYYGYRNIPKKWLNTLSGYEGIVKTGRRMMELFYLNHNNKS